MAAIRRDPPTLERRDDYSRQALVRRVVGEFQEMPCLRLSAPQAQRLFGLRADICMRVLAGLVAGGTLSHDALGRYHLNDSSSWPAASAGWSTRRARPAEWLRDEPALIG